MVGRSPPPMRPSGRVSGGCRCDPVSDTRGSSVARTSARRRRWSCRTRCAPPPPAAAAAASAAAAGAAAAPVRAGATVAYITFGLLGAIARFASMIGGRPAVSLLPRRSRRRSICKMPPSVPPNAPFS